MNASMYVKDKEYFGPLDLALRSIDLLFVEYILHFKIPSNCKLRGRGFDKSDKEETSSSNKFSKRSKTDVSVILIRILKTG